MVPKVTAGGLQKALGEHEKQLAALLAKFEETRQRRGDSDSEWNRK